MISPSNIGNTKVPPGQDQRNNQEPWATTTNGTNGTAAAGEFNVVQPLKRNTEEPIKVAVRLRPQIDPISSMNMDKQQKVHEDKRAWNIERGTVGLETLISQKGHHGHGKNKSVSTSQIDGETVFSFTNVFDESTKTPTVYKSVCRQLGKDVLKGKHATIIVVGEDGSGKSFTLQGDASSSSPLGSPTRNDGGQAGVIQLAIADLFRAMKRKSEGGPTEHEFRVKVSYLEIFDDGQQMKDLLCNVDGDTSYMVEDGESTIVKHIVADTSEDVLDLLSHGNFQKKISQTVSTVFRLTVESIELLENTDPEENEKVCERYADFDFVDLAGSDSVDVSIDQNLISTSPNLSQIMHLKDSEIALLACVSPTKASIEEAKGTFQLAFKAQTVSTLPVLNEAINDLDPSFLEGGEAEEQGSLGSEPEPLPPSEREEEEEEEGEGEGEGEEEEEPDDAAMQKDDQDLEGEEEEEDDDDDESEDEESEEDEEPDEDEPELILEDSKPDVPKVPEEDDISESEMRQNRIKELRQQRAAAEAKLREQQNGERLSPTQQHENRVSTDVDDTLPSPAADDVPANQEVAENNVKERSTAQPPSVSTEHFHLPESVNAESDDLAGLKANIDPNLSSIEPVSNVAASSSTPEKRLKKVPDARFDSPNNRTHATTITDDESFLSIRGGSQASTINNDATRAEVKRVRGDELSWDTMMIDASREEQVGRPINIPSDDEVQIGKDEPPQEVTVLLTSKSFDGGDHVSLMKELMVAQERIRFLEGQLEEADVLIEGTFRDLDRARRSVQDLSKRNAEMTYELSDKRRDYTKEDYETGEVIVESYWMLKAGVYLGLFSFIFFDSEYFLACAFFVWLILETNMTVQ
mmetsp:Transcript_22197/g.52209  ORF Transcript_22197/g.52209 Transcript_22197/m.52209 type:complete len:865 (-) Transcript_22197:49-2643(-)